MAINENLALKVVKLLLSRDAAYAAIKKSAFGVLICLITNEIFTSHYGKYSFTPFEYKVFIATYPNRLIFVLFVFAALFFFAYSFEKIILPFIMIQFGKYDPKSFRKSMVIANKMVFRFAKKEEVKDAMAFINEYKFEIYGYLAYLPNLLILASIWLSLKISIVFLFLIPIVFICLRSFLKVLNTAIEMILKLK